MPRFKVQVLDHRRRPTTLIRPDSLGQTRPGQMVLTPEQRDRVIANMKMDLPGPRFWIAAGIGMGLWLSAIVVCILVARLIGLPAWVVWAFVVLAPVGVPIVFARAGHWYISRVRHRQMINAMIETGLCSACAYRIDNLALQPDGCVVCPECGAAWRTAPAH